MTPYVVDTNVAIAANGKDTHADLDCQKACVKELRDICSGKMIALDDAGWIFDEYKQNLKFAGAPGVGDVFFKHVHNHQYRENLVQRVRITLCDDDRRGFDELPENGLDRSDRKFLATARVAHATILNATDNDWSEQETLTSNLGVGVRQICPHHASKK